MAAVEQQQQQSGVSTEKVEASSGHFNPVVYSPPRKLLGNMAAHESLLKRLGLWDFLNLDFDDSVRTDLIEELVVSYKYYPRKYTGESHAHGLSISLNRLAVANALRLPVERAVGGGSFSVSKEEESFLEEVIRGFLVLRDDGEGASSVMSQVYVVLRKMRFDWAGLVWFMMERELLKGKNLAKCHYASHLQLVLKHQRPQLFDEHGDSDDHGSSIDEDPHQPELEFKSVAERNRGSLDDFSGNELECQEVEVGRTLDLLATLTAHDEVVMKGSSEGLDSQDIENQFNPELEFKSATELNGDSVTHAARDCQEVDLNSAAYNAGREVEFGSFVDLLVAQEARGHVVKNKGSTDGLYTRKIVEDGGYEFILEKSEGEDKHRIQQKNVKIIDEYLDVETELRLAQTEKEGDAMGTLVNQTCEGKISDLQGNIELKIHEVQNDVCPKKCDASGTTETGMNPLLVASDLVPGKRETDHAPETQDVGREVDKSEEKFLRESFVLQHGTCADHPFVVPKAPSVQGKASRTPVSVGHFASETDIGASDERGEESDIVFCAEQIEAWTARLKNFAGSRAEVVLQKKIEEQNQLIQQYESVLQTERLQKQQRESVLQKERQQKHQYELMLQKERQQKQRSDSRYEWELHGMTSLVGDYKKIIKSSETKFAEYRERAQLPEEPLYMPHPDGGGKVILVSEWKALEEERQRQRLSDIQATVDDFEAEWTSNMEEQLRILDVYCDKLGDLEHDVRSLSGRL